MRADVAYEAWVSVRATGLEAAVQSANVEAVYRFVAEGGRADLQFDDGSTPLLAAIEYGCAQLLPVLVAGGADVNARQGLKLLTPLRWACLCGSSRSVKRALINLGARVDLETVDVARTVARSGLGNAHLDLLLAQIHHGYAGVFLAPHNVEALALARLGVERGAVIINVAKFSVAERVGIMRDDVVVALDGKGVEWASDLAERLARRWAGDVATLDIVRAGVRKEFVIELQPADTNKMYV